MEMKSTYYALEKVAKKHGVPIEEVIDEIEKALAHSSVCDGAIQEMSAAEAVAYLRDQVIERIESYNI